ncbi:gfo/Idh/MocA family oxidoreductase [Kitasatospora sp. NBC_01560]|uniref:Gfo/Idh/MocA family protein n=1 Tax=Kitasatospora sp. NBC_01560 TaxID=2975965 RepID=UPI00386DE188
MRCGPVRLAVLGTAHVHLPDHLAAVTAAAGVELTAVHAGRGPWPELPAEVRRAATAEQALAGADAALIASTTAEHAALLHLVAAAGLPVLCEKPLGRSAAETADLLAVLAAGGSRATTAMFLRCTPALRRLRELLAGRRLGRIASVEAGFAHPGLTDGLFAGPAGWMLDPAAGAAGAFADLAVHLVDLLLWLDGGAVPEVLGAALRHRPGTVPDVGGAALLSWGGVPVSLHAGWAARPGGLSVRVAGERGTAVVEGGRLVLTGALELTAATAAPYAGAATEAFLAGLRGEEVWEAPTAAELLRAAAVLDAVAEAAARAPTPAVRTATSATCANAVAVERTYQSLTGPAGSTAQGTNHTK